MRLLYLILKQFENAHPFCFIGHRLKQPLVVFDILAMYEPLRGILLVILNVILREHAQWHAA